MSKPKTRNSFALWMDRRGLAIDEAAELLKVSGSVVYKWRQGSRRPSLMSALLINDISDGAVPPSSWR